VVEDGHPMALELTREGDTEEDEDVAHLVKVNLKQRAKISKGKGKLRDQGKRDQQSDREPRLLNHHSTFSC